MKKFLSLLLCALILVSCAAAASAEEPVKIDFWHSWGSGSNYEAITELVTRFNEENKGKIEVTEQYIGGYADTLSKCIVGYTANENPTVCVVDACMTLNAVENGIMENLTAYTAKNDADYDFGQFLPGMMVYPTDPEGNVWSIPYARSTQIMYCNMDLVREIMGADAKVPETWDDITAFCEGWYNKYQTPAYSHPCNGGFYVWMIGALYQGEYFTKDGNGACCHLNDAWEKALTEWRRTIDNGWYLIPSLTTAGFYEDFMAGKLPIIFHSTGALTNTFARAEGVFDVAVCYLPGSKQADGSVYRAVQTGGANLMLCNNKTDAEKAAGWEFLKFMTSAETNVYHSFKTGYVLTHVGLEDNETVKAKWEAAPQFKTAYDQLQFVHELYVSIYTSEVDLEIIDAITAFAMDNVSVKDTMAELENICESILPNGICETYE